MPQFGDWVKARTNALMWTLGRESVQSIAIVALEISARDQEKINWDLPQRLQI